MAGIYASVVGMDASGNSGEVGSTGGGGDGSSKVSDDYVKGASVGYEVWSGSYGCGYGGFKFVESRYESAMKVSDIARSGGVGSDGFASDRAPGYPDLSCLADAMSALMDCCNSLCVVWKIETSYCRQYPPCYP